MFALKVGTGHLDADGITQLVLRVMTTAYDDEILLVEVVVVITQVADGDHTLAMGLVDLGVDAGLPCGTCELPAEGLQQVTFVGDMATCSSGTLPVPCPASEVTWWARLQKVLEVFCTSLRWAPPFSTPTFSACLAPNSETLWAHCGHPGLSHLVG